MTPIQPTRSTAGAAVIRNGDGRSIRRDLLAVALLGAIFLAAVAIVDPRGNVPLDDDWDYALVTWTFIKTGVIQFTPFTSASLRLQVLWGGLWTLVFGESFTVLRSSILTLSLGSVLLLFGLGRRAGLTARASGFAALAFLVHPLFFWASFTYMAHVGEVFVSLVALHLFLTASASDRLWPLVAALAACIGSFFVRQIGVLNAVVPLVVVIASRETLGFRWKRLAWAYGGALAAFFILMFGTRSLVSSPEELRMHESSFSGGWRALLMTKVAGPAHYAFFNFQNAGLFFLPLVVIAVAAWRARSPSMRILAPVAVVFLAASLHMCWLHRPIPYFNSGNVFADLGLGPHTLRDTFIFRMPYPHHLAYSARLALMLLSTVAAIVAATMTIASLPARDTASTTQRLVIRYASLFALLGTVIVAFMRLYFDRYSIDTLWPLAILLPLVALKAPVGRVLRATAIVVLFATALFSLAATQEYLDWNRARWAAVHDLHARGITLEQMDGGYEVNAFLAVARGRKDLGKPGFGVVDDRYILAFNEVPGYTTVAKYPYRRVLGLATGYVHVEVRR